MKDILLALTVLLPLTAFAAEKEAKVSVKGMVCAFCAQGITKKFKAEPAVAKVDVSLEKKLVTIDFKDGQDIDDQKIETILTESGYNIEKIDRSGK
jgi:mercuric ion binding protein